MAGVGCTMNAAMPGPMGVGVPFFSAGLRFLPPWTVVGVLVGAAFVDGLGDSFSSSTMMQSSALASSTATSFGMSAAVDIDLSCSQARKGVTG